MHSIGLDDVGDAILLTLVLLTLSISVVAASMFWLYRYFKNKDESRES